MCEAFNASVERLAKSPPYVWWYAKDLKPFAQAVLALPDEAIVEQHDGQREDGSPERWFKTPSTMTTAFGEAVEDNGGSTFNVSHTFPPPPPPPPPDGG